MHPDQTHHSQQQHQPTHLATLQQHGPSAHKSTVCVLQSRLQKVSKSQVCVSVCVCVRIPLSSTPCPCGVSEGTAHSSRVFIVQCMPIPRSCVLPFSTFRPCYLLTDLAPSCNSKQALKRSFDCLQTARYSTWGAKRQWSPRGAPRCSCSAAPYRTFEWLQACQSSARSYLAAR